MMKPSMKRLLHQSVLSLSGRTVRDLERKLPSWKLFFASNSAPAGVGPLVRDQQLAILESLLFAADEPLSPRRLASLLKIRSTETIRNMIKRLGSLYDAENGALQLVELAGGVQLRTREQFVPWLLKLQPAPHLNLTAASRETLTMIAYKQPITRADLDSLRGVSCIEALRTLLEKGLIRIVGRDKSLGRPVLYGTTRLFLENVGLNSLDALPKLSD